MNKQKMILGAVAAVITVGSGLALKAATKFNAHPVFGRTNGGVGRCTQARTFFSKVGASLTATRGKTNHGVVTVFAPGVNGKTWARTSVNCNPVVTKVTTVK